ncbi:hypothetical protein ACFV2Z_40265 [Streptomyces sp. NPDC059688]|uniref:hypothetical protein n=1 Tax=Streptomyces sp. NPDC059688 TaxID=3346906 RepID=UPI0036CDF73F
MTLAARAGQPISDDTRQDVQDTLHAVLADPDAARQWAKGRLTKPLSAPAGFPTLARQPAPPAPTTSPNRCRTHPEPRRASATPGVGRPNVLVQIEQLPVR